MSCLLVGQDCPSELICGAGEDHCAASCVHTACHLLVECVMPTVVVVTTEAGMLWPTQLRGTGCLNLTSYMLHSLATSAYGAALLTTAECAASLLLATRLFRSCSACCRIKALRCVGPAKCCCSSAMLLNVACSIETHMVHKMPCPVLSAANRAESIRALTLLNTKVRPGDDQTIT